MAGITWLHLSDWHQKGKDFDRIVVRDALMEDIRNRTKISPSLEKIDFVVFSGDVAFHGKAQEYQVAIREFFDPLLEAAGVGRDRLMIVPGNHDLEREMLETLPGDLAHTLSTPAAVNEWLTDDRRRRALLAPMENYSRFVADYLGREAAGSEPAYATVRHFEAEGKSVAFIGLNSAWLCARHKEKQDGQEEVDDYGHLVVGEPQVYEAFNRAADADWRIAVIHHPFDWLKTKGTLAERSIIRRRLYGQCHFILHGHEHEPDVSVSRGTIGNSVVISAGASYDRREPTASRYANGYNFVHLDLATRQGTAYLRRYEDRQGWIRDTGTAGDEKSGYTMFALDKPSTEPFSSEQPTALGDKISLFDEEKLRTLCCELDIDYERLAGQDQASKTDALVEKCKDRLPELIQACVRAQPDVRWSDRRVRVVIAHDSRYNSSRELAEHLKGSLTREGHTVQSVDVRERPKADWQVEIEKSDYFLFLLSPELAASDGGELKGLVNWAYSNRMRQGRPDLLCVRASFARTLPKWLQGQVKPREYVLWQDRNDNEHARAEILAVIQSGLMPDLTPLRTHPQAPKRPQGEPAARRVFISYKRDDASQELAQFLWNYLQESDHLVFMDLEMLPGERFWDRIEQEIRESDYLIVLLSPESADSEMVQAEVERAYQYRERQGHPDILPVRIAYEGILPLAINVYVRRCQYVLWRDRHDNQMVGNRILQALQTGRPVRMPPLPMPPCPAPCQVMEDGAEAQAGETVPRPRPQFDWRLLEDPGQIVSLRNDLYVPRDADELIKRQVTSAGTFTTLRAPRQTGKTSLLVRAIQHARDAKAQVAYVDLQLGESQRLESEDSFLRWLADLIVSKLGIGSDEDLVGTFWTRKLSPVQKLTQLMEHHVLPHQSEPLVLAIDEVERLVAARSTNGLGMRFQDDVQALCFQNDILGMLRAWRNSMAFGEPWDRLSIVLALDTEPYLLIRDPYQSPFNVGVRVQLDDFTFKQVQYLNAKHGGPVEDESCLMKLLNGHPYLTRRALYTLVKPDWSWSQLDSEAAKDDGPFNDHLRRYYWLLHDNPDQCAALGSIIQHGKCGDEAFRRLERTGLVKGAPADARCRCELYERYFKDKL